MFRMYSNLSLSIPIGVLSTISPCYSEYGLWTSLSVLPENWLERQNLRPHNENMHFNRLLKLYAQSSSRSSAKANLTLKMRKQIQREVNPTVPQQVRFQQGSGEILGKALALYS